MMIDKCEFLLDSLSKFHNTLYIHGWFHSLSDELKSIELDDPHELESMSRVRIPHGGVRSLGENKGFLYQSLRSTDDLDLDIKIAFLTENGRRLETTLRMLSEDRRSRYATPLLARRFHEELRGRGARAMLDIGGRDRSKIDRSKEFPFLDVTVLDILASTNVDVVGDAHEISSLFPPESFDAVYSNSVWEHLAMPWRVVVEMNRVMRMGGIGLIATHQTLGMHDLPWDFFRFSDSTWDSLLNEATGFRIIDRAMDSEQFVIPFIYRPGKEHAEWSAGYEGSAVFFEKIGNPRVDWPVKLSDIITTTYPNTEEGN
ncbi:MAG TPA: methyltransferase domain-containing protein [Devosia sp.]|nr:methyltransferase domain-containing protein [Devosia sp.]